VRSFVAWRTLAHERGRSVLAVLGIFIAVHLIFMQLGFYNSVPRGGMLIYDALAFDVILVSGEYVFQGQSREFPRRRLLQALAHPDVARAAPLYQNAGVWTDAEGRRRREIFVMGFNVDEPVFNVPAIEAQRDKLRILDTVLIDEATRPEFGPQTPGRRAEIDGRTVEIAGTYRLGTGFVALGVVVASDLTFVRIFKGRSVESLAMGLLTLKPGADAERVAAELGRTLPRDVRVLSRAQLAGHEIGHWMTRTSTGLVWGFGLVISFVVGAAILFQTLATQVRRHLPAYATLKAMGYTDRYLGGIVVLQAVMIAVLAFLPAFALSLFVYRVTRENTLLPIFMTEERVAGVLAVTIVMSVVSALFALRNLRKADPVDLF